MDYEKKYKEALEKAKFYYDNWPLENEKNKLENMFPELRESEDERIRKEIIAFLKHYHTGEGDSVTYDNDWLVYLEKQKEQKPKNILTDKDTIQAAYCKGQTDVIEDPEAYGLCKPSEWSEKDEKMIWNIVDVLEADNEENKKKFPYALILHEQYKKMVDWLISLRPRPSWKPSEEQMEALKSFLDYHRPIRNGSVQNWLKFNNLESLYEQLKKL